MITREQAFVSTDWLQDNLGPDITVVDASWHLPGVDRDAIAEFAEQHIPGAVFFDIDAVADRDTDLPHMLPTPEAFAEAVGALGIDETRSIIIYDSLGLFSAPRAWWTFRLMGARDVRILDGGLPKWLREGRPTETGAPQPNARTFQPDADPSLVRTWTDVRKAVETGAEQVLDARPRARFLTEAPEPRPTVKPGRMPGSFNLPITEIIADGHLNETAALRQAIADAGIDLDKPVITSCGSGITAAVLTLALELAGAREHSLYDGSWTEWGSRDDTPIETGPLG